MSGIYSKKVSVIIPVYNVERYVEQCIKSALYQTYENKEIIVIDDGSSDLSGAIVKSLCEKYKQIVIFRTENQGQSIARNIGLDIATGDYVLFLDSDDWIDEKTLEICVNTFAKQDVDIVMFNGASFVDGINDSVKDNFLYERSGTLTNTRMKSVDFFCRSIEINNYIVSPCLYMYKTNRYKNLRFYPKIIHEDNLFTTQLLLSNPNATLYSLKEAFFHRRLRENSTMTAKKSVKNIDGYLEVSRELIIMLKKTKDRNLSKCLSKFISILIFNAFSDALLIYKNKVPFELKVSTLSMYLKVNLRCIEITKIIKIVFPSAGYLKNKILGIR